MMTSLNIRIAYLGEKPAKCEACGVAFRTEKALLRHKYTSAHIDKLGEEPIDQEKEYLCSSCGKSYFTYESLNFFFHFLC